MTIAKSLTNSFYNSSFQLLTPQQSPSDYPLFLYLPGMDGTGRLFENQTAKLASCFNLRCLSISPNDMSEWGKLTTTVINLIEDELVARGKDSLYLCGESFGGCLALKIAEARPELIEKLILVNPASAFNRQPILSWGIPITRYLPDWLHRTSAVALLPFLAELNRIKGTNSLALLEAMKSLPSEVVSWRLSLLQQFAVSESGLSSFQKPTLAIASAADRLLPSVTEAQKLVNIFPQGKMEILPESGHACLLEGTTDLYEILCKNQFL
ncbi:MAG: alpha/beta hydrolase [Xenococcaceae cyanobacterium MO_207.B15]|nr:alpha/beta hydrolase [Xenococcaceae cyanobacterium MO_207.B15]